MSWPSVKLSDVLEFHRGITFKPEDKVETFSPSSVVCMRTKNVQEQLDESDIIAVPESFVKRDELYLQEGDLLISSANSWNLVGKVVRIPQLNYRATAGGFISILRPLKQLIDPDYLYRFIGSDEQQHKIRHLGRQTTNISNLDRKRFLDLRIPLPPLSIQKQIAAVLEKADNLRQQSQQMEQELNSLAQSVFLDMFGDPVINSNKWPTQTLKAISKKFNDGPFGSNLKTSHYKASGVQVIRLTNIGVGFFKGADKAFVSEEHAMTLDRFHCHPGDIVIATLGEPNLRACLIPDSVPLAINKADCIHCIPDENLVLKEYLVQYLNFPTTLQSIQSMLHGQTRTRISSGQLAKINILIPPLRLQEQFLTFVYKLDEKKELIKRTRKNHQELFKSLMQRAFKGELDLKDVA